MKLELFPNEILLDLFGYLNGTDLLRAFSGINSRFNLLLYQQYRSYWFRFEYVSKRDFDVICQEHFPLIADRIVALYLSDYEQTPKQIDLFFSYVPSWKNFIHLQTLEIYHCHSYQMLLKLLDECQHLSNLTCLKFYSRSFEDSSADFPSIVNTLWSFPKLRHCHVHMKFEGNELFSIPTVVSSSIKSLTILGSHLQWNQINQLIEYTPRLKSLSAFIQPFSNPTILMSVYSTLIQCNLHIYRGFLFANADIIFQSVPNLRHLNIDIWSVLINGDQWEHLIRNYLSKLKIFRLKMEKYFFSKENLEKQADDLFNSFRSPFWIDEHQWYVRCFTENTIIYLSSRVNTSHYSDNKLPDSWRSTDPNDNIQQFSNQITSVYDKILFEKSILFNISLPNIEYLNLSLPIDDRFWSIVPNLNRLKSVLISSYNDKYQFQVQTLLDRSPHLQTLSLTQDGSLPFQVSLFNYTNRSIRQLNLLEYYLYFNDDQCLLFARSSLAIQCEVLSIRLTNHQCIIHLLKNIPNLRALIVICQDNQSLQWLKTHLPSTYLIVRDRKDKRKIFIWI